MRIQTCLFLVILTFVMTSAYAQQPYKLVAKLKDSPKSLSRVSGLSISPADEARQPDAFRIQDHMLERIFPYAGKHEARHRQYGLHLWYQMVIDPADSSQITEQLTAFDLFESVTVEPLPQLQQMAPVPDSLFARQWYLQNDGQTKGSPGADISFVNAHKIQKGKKDIILSIHDSGYDTLHTDILDNLWVNEGEIPDNGIDDDNNGYIDDIHGWNFASRNNDLQDRNGHGTAIAGIIANKSNGSGLIGIAGGDAPDNGIKIMICRLDNDWPDLAVIRTEASIVYAADNGSMISSNSWNTFGRSSSVLRALEYYADVTASEYLESGLIIFSAGNRTSFAERYETEEPNVMMIGSTDHNDRRSSFSNYGEWLALSAPGEDIFTNAIGGGFTFVNGTSFAAPMVSAVAALVLSEYGHPEYTIEELQNRLLNGVDDIDSLNGNFGGRLGSGRLNAFKALVAEESNPPDRVANLWIDAVHGNWIDVGLVAPPDETIAPFQYNFTIINLTATDTTAVSLPVKFPEAGDSLIFRLEELNPFSDYAISVTGADYFGNISESSDTVYATTPGPPVVALPDYQPIHTFLRDTLSDYKASLTIKNTGESSLTWQLTERSDTNRFDGYTVRYATDIYDEIDAYVGDLGGNTGLLPYTFTQGQLDSTNLLVLEDNIRNYDSLRLVAMRQWVRKGGNLIVGVDFLGLTMPIS